MKKSRRQSYEQITTCEAESLQEAFSYLNQKLFDGNLPDAFIRYETKANSDGFYTPHGFSGRAAKFGKDAITLNSSRFDGRTDKQILGNLYHQMRHHWQYHFGKKPNRHYHDEEWSQGPTEIGLQPSSTGEKGGKITGQRMSQYIVPGGQFDQVCDELIATGWKLNLQSSHQPGATRVKKNKPDFMCPQCSEKFWGKASSRWICWNDGFLALPVGGDWSKKVRFELIKWSDEKPDTAEAQSYETTKPKRGRPKGSKNKRKPGRPKGSKNKPKLAVQSYEQSAT